MKVRGSSEHEKIVDVFEDGLCGDIGEGQQIGMRGAADRIGVTTTTTTATPCATTICSPIASAVKGGLTSKLPFIGLKS
jgi:hypothetical protein